MNPVLQQKLLDLPSKPGCYLFRDRKGTIIYIGKALSLRKRVQSYFRPATLRKAPPKLRSLINSVADLDTLVLPSEAQALLAEARLIKQYRPRYNILLRDDKNFLAIRADATAELPRLTVVRFVRDDNAQYFGPFPSSAVVRAALDFTQRHFHLRVCSPTVPGEDDHAHCHDRILRFCSAPCVHAISHDDYRAAFNEACAFLSGHRPAILDALRQQMNDAAQQLDFETAATFRDTLHALTQIIRHRRHQLPTHAPSRDQDETAAQALAQLQHLLHLPAPPRHIECFDNSNLFGTHAVSSMVRATDGRPDPKYYRHFRVKTLTQADDPRTMEEIVTRRYTRVIEENQTFPDLIVLDGGMQQLLAARRALAALNLAIPTIGLAERHEEIITGPGDPPLLLDKDSPPLLLLMRLRDEAHRFAVSHHRRVRNRAIRQSVLDDIPGIGDAKKTLLLKTFGSVRRIAKATPEALAALPGITPALAAEILRAVAQGRPPEG